MYLPKTAQVEGTESSLIVSLAVIGQTKGSNLNALTEVVETNSSKSDTFGRTGQADSP